MSGETCLTLPFRRCFDIVKSRRIVRIESEKSGKSYSKLVHNCIEMKYNLDVIKCCVVLCCVVLCCVVLCCVVLCCVVLCYVMLCYVRTSSLADIQTLDLL